MKKGPVIFLSLLVVVLIFILGVQYGKSLRVTDEAIEILLKRVPSPTQIPAKELSPIVYKSLTSKRCGFSFVYPSSFDIELTSTYSAQLLDDDQIVIAFSCSPMLDTAQYNNIKYASSSATFGGAPATQFVADEDKTVVYTLEHPKRNSLFEIQIAPEARLLIEKSIVFVE